MNKIVTYFQILSRIDYLRQKFKDDLLEKNKKYIDENFANQPIDIVFDLLFEELENTDPTKKKIYLQWIIQQNLSGKLLREDFYKVKQDLTLFDLIKSKLPVAERDINYYKSYRDLYKTIQPFETKDNQSNRSKDRKYEELLFINKEATLFYNDTKLKIIIPHTHNASCWFGKQTRWCTTLRNDAQPFIDYDGDGPLYIVFDKTTNQKYQFHFESKQFMNAEDETITPLSEFSEDILDIFNKLFYEQIKKI